MSKLNELLEKRNELNKQIQEEGKADFGAMVAGIFETYPELKNFGWWNEDQSAYNDGDYPGLTGVAINVDTEDGYVHLDPIYWSASWSKNPKPEGYDAQEAVRKHLEPFKSLVLDIFPQRGIIVVFPTHLEHFDSPGY